MRAPPQSAPRLIAVHLGVIKPCIYDHLADGSFKVEIARPFPFTQTVKA